MSYKDNDKIWDRKSHQVEQVEACGDLVNQLLNHIQTCVGELGKEKQISKNKMDDACQGFKDTLKEIEDKLDKVLEELYLVNSSSYSHQGTDFESSQKIALAKSTERFLHEELRRMHEKHFPSQSNGDDELGQIDTQKLPSSSANFNSFLDEF